MENKNINTNTIAAFNTICTLETATDTLEAISDYIYRKLMVAQECPEDYNGETIALLTDINNKVYRMTERCKVELTMTASVMG